MKWSNDVGTQPLERERLLRKNQKMNERWKFVNLSREGKCNGTLSNAASSLITPLRALLIEPVALGFNNAATVISRGLLGTYTVEGVAMMIFPWKSELIERTEIREGSTNFFRIVIFSQWFGKKFYTFTFFSRVS